MVSTVTQESKKTNETKLWDMIKTTYIKGHWDTGDTEDIRDVRDTGDTEDIRDIKVTDISDFEDFPGSNWPKGLVRKT